MLKEVFSTNNTRYEYSNKESFTKHVLGILRYNGRFDKLKICIKNLYINPDYYGWCGIRIGSDFIYIRNCTIYVCPSSKSISDSISTGFRNSNLTFQLEYINGKLYCDYNVDGYVKKFEVLDTDLDYSKLNEVSVIMCNYNTSNPSSVSFDSMSIYVNYTNSYLLKHNNSFYSTNCFNDTEYTRFLNIDEIPENKYITDLNEIVTAKNIDNLYPMNIIIKR